MKNLLIYIGPEPKFSSEHGELTKIQIDNSLDLGWTPEDILLVTDFPYEYRGVKAYVVSGNFWALDGNRSTKILVINQLFNDGIIKEGEVYWFHDHDAFQLEPFKTPQVKIAAFTDHGWWKTWNAGSFFFTSKAKDLFEQIYTTMLANNSNEQNALTHLWETGAVEKTLLNITYNIGIYHLYSNIKMADKPLLVFHFHPHKPKHFDLFRNLMPKRLLTIFANYGLK